MVVMTRIRPTAGFLLATVLGAGFLGACGGDPDASPSPGPSTSPASTAPTTPAAPTLPPQARSDTRAGAKAFVRHYIDLLNHAQATGSTGQLVAASSPQCQECVSITAKLQALYTNGGHISGGELIAERLNATPLDADQGWSVFVQLTSGPQVVYEAGGATPQTLPGGRRSMLFVVVREHSDWKVREWSQP